MILVVLALCAFASSMSARIVDPMVTALAGDLHVPVAQAALLASAYSLPFAVAQPVLGPLGDLFSKGRLVQIAAAALTVLLAGSALANSFGLLFAGRVFAGCAGAAILPIAFALVGDAVPLARRQLAISRILAASLFGQLLGASAAGVIAAVLDWRIVFALVAAFTGIAATAAFWKLPAEAPRAPSGADGGLHAVAANYGRVLRNPRAYCCFGVVLVEGAAIYGWLPFVGDRLAAAGAGGSREAGLVIGALAIGGLLYSASVGALLKLVARPTLMAIGGTVAGLGIALLAVPASWPVQAATMALVGFGFFMLHNSVQTEVSDLAPAARASAFSLHAFSFYLGQAVGPALYGLALPGAGAPACLAVAAIAFALVGLVAGRVFRRRNQSPST